MKGLFLLSRDKLGLCFFHYIMSTTNRELFEILQNENARKRHRSLKAAFHFRVFHTHVHVRT